MKLNEVLEQNKALWVDDIRNPPPSLNVDVVRTYDEAIEKLSSVNYDEIYLDHDLGDINNRERNEKTGYDVCLWLAERKQEGGHVPSVYHFLTANPIGRQRMAGVIQRYLS